MKTLFALTLCFLAILPISTAHGMSFLDKEHSEKLKKEAKLSGDATRQIISTSQSQGKIKTNTTPDSLTPLQLFASPIQPGGKGLSINLVNTLRLISPKLAKKLTRGKSLVEQYVDNLVETDEEIIRFRNDDRPLKNWKLILKALKDEKRKMYTEYVLRMAL